MKSRKVILIACIAAAAVLFANGMSILLSADIGHDLRHGKINFIQNEGTAGENPKSGNSPVNILVLGLDGEEVRSDVIVLLNFSPKFDKMNILSVARDTKIRTQGKNAKINSLVGIGNEKLIIDKIEEITGLYIDYYITLNFRGFRKAIDALNGVTINIPVDMNYDDPEQNLHIHLKKGLQLLDGEKAEEFVRYRKGNKAGEGYEDGDIGRIRMQQELIKAIIDQKLKIKYISKADEIFYILKKYMRSNIQIGDVNYYMKNLKKLKIDEIKTFTLPGESAYIDGLWYFIYDRERAKEIIRENFYG